MSSEWPDQVEVGTRDTMAEKMVRLIAESARTSIQTRDVFTLAIPGGSIADAVIPLLIVQDLPWEKVHVFWVDERVVPLTDVNSNAGHAFRLWQGSYFASATHLHVMFGEPSNYQLSDETADTTASISATAADMDLAVNRYSRLLEEVCGAPVTLDVALLGVGEDGHIASLFPDHATAFDIQHTVIAVTDSPKPPAERLSLSYGVIANAREIIVAAFGDGKAAAMQQALENEKSQMPVARIIREAKIVHTLLDAASASALRSK
ncbi:MAG: 6-phosphogluconolactonase [Gemmatimonadaceae bacterium]